MPNSRTPLTLATTAVLLLAAVPAAWAGRPLTVDDANVNETGAGHLEAWTARDAGKTTSYNLAPAFAPIDNLEIGALLSRSSANGNPQTSAVQLKWRITPSQAQGCNFGAVLGTSRTTQGGGSANYVNGLLTCNTELGSLHFNRGGTRPSGGRFAASWGMALEREVGAVTPHAEWFGAQGTSPTFQLGARTELTKGWQLDGTVGRSGGVSVYSLGVKAQF